MAGLSLALYLVALALAVAAAWVARSGNRADLRARVASRFGTLPAFHARDVGGRNRRRGTFIDRWLWRAGIKLTPLRVLLAAVALAALVAVVWGNAGHMAGIIVLAAAIAGILAWPQVQYRKRAAAMVAQIPLFLDQVVRGLATGRNLDGALRLASEETREPLGEVMAKVRQAADLGEDIGEALKDAARLYRLRELHLVALAVHIAHGYGSSPKEMLESAAQLIRHREQARRELRALTGETRISAWLLGILPSALALYMVAVNPDYINTMWFDPAGRFMLLLALALQVIGAAILWRMVKSI